LGSVLNDRISPKFGATFSTLQNSYVLIVTKLRLGYTLGDLFRKLIWSPCLLQMSAGLTFVDLQSFCIVLKSAPRTKLDRIFICSTSETINQFECFFLIKMVDDPFFKSGRNVAVAIVPLMTSGIFDMT
jgi:hypothetical protein